MRCFHVATNRLLAFATVFCLATSAPGLVHGAEYVIDDEKTRRNGGHPFGGGDTLIITETGSIVRVGSTTYAVYGTAGNQTVINRGFIEHRGSNVRGIYFSRGGNTIINHGTIHGTKRKSSDVAAPSIDAWGGNNILINYGTIRNGSRAMGARGGNDVLINYGLTDTRGNYGDGLRVDGNDSFIINHGIAIARGKYADALNVLGARGTITNSGKAVSRKDNAIHFLTGDGHTLNLLAPSYLEGAIDLADGTTVNVMTGPSHSVLWGFQGTMDGDAPVMRGPVEGFYNPATQQYATFDPTLLVGKMNQFGHMQSLLSSVGRKGLARAERPTVQIADASGAAPVHDGVLPQGARIWTAVFGGTYEHDRTAGTFEHAIDLKGFALGYSGRATHDVSFSAMAGYLTGNHKADSKYAPSYRLDSTGAFAGVNGRLHFAGIDFDAGLTGGRISYSSDRFVNDNEARFGASWATASYDGWFVSPEVGISAAFAWTDIVTVRPALRLAYTHHAIDGYTEGGGRANFTVDDQALSLLSGTAELTVEKRILGTATIHATGGYTMRRTLNDASVELVGATGDIDISAADSDAYFVGGAVTVDLLDAVRLAVEATMIDGKDYSGIEGAARVSVAF